MPTLLSDPSTLEATLSQAILLHRAGNLEQAERLYRGILAEQPNHADACHNLGILAMQAGHAAAALRHFKEALEADPRQSQYWLSCIEALLRTGQAEVARHLLAAGQKHGLAGDVVEAFSQRMPFAESAPPSPLNDKKRSKSTRQERRSRAGKQAARAERAHAGTHLSQGVALQLRGQSTDAEASYRRALELDPNLAEAHCNLAGILKSQGRLSEAGAEACYRRAIEINPRLAEAHSNLANSLQRQGRYAEAEAACRQAIEINPRLAEAHSNLAGALQQQHRYVEAEAACRRALEINPLLVEAHSNLAVALQRQGCYAAAEVACRHALELDPNYADAHNTLGTLLRSRGLHAEAEGCCRRALQINPALAEAHSNLGSMLMKRGDFREAEACCHRALEIKPYLSEARSSLANILLETGRLDEAEVCCRQALASDPSLAETHSLLLFCLSHNESISPQSLFAEHLRFAERFEAPLRPDRVSHANSRDPERRLHVGFVSADLWHHAVASFLEPVLESLATSPDLSAGFVPHAYSNHPIEDAVTARLRRHFSRWTSVTGVSDQALAQKIRTDGIDILIDLSGHTTGHRLLTFARKPAPLQASWIGYPGTTGLEAMDYLLADRFFLPREQFDSQFTEKIVHLPAVGAFLPSKASPPVNPLPALSNGYLTFGSFNRPAKLSPSVVALWSQLLRAIPEAQMILGAMPKDDQSSHLLAWFHHEGIARERLHFYPRSGMTDYLRLHHQVDFCLDAFPYSGATTTYHALWMGVPTLTLAGPTPSGRDGMAILNHVGLQSFVATGKSDFVQKGLHWGQNLSELASIRTDLRERFAQSDPGRPEVVAAGLTRALRTMWRRWCAGLPPEAF